MQAMRCTEFEQDGTIARYAAGALSQQDSEAFEDHYLLCERCQASVRAASGVRHHFAGGARIRNRRPWLVGLAAAALAAVALFNIADLLQTRRLGDVSVAPVYLGSPVRAGSTSDAAAFDAAMLAYNDGRYEEALERLQQIGDGDGRIVVDFFAGASALMLERARDAQASFTAVIARGDSPFHAEALYYRAKAFLQRGKRASAIADLRQAVALDSPVREEAQSLLKQLED